MPDEVITLEKGRGSVPITGSSLTDAEKRKKARKKSCRKKRLCVRVCVCVSSAYSNRILFVYCFIAHFVKKSFKLQCL